MNLSKDTYLYSGNQQPIGETWLPTIRTRLHDLGAWVAARRTRAREMRELHRFSERELWDVGLSRSDILAIEQGTFRRD